MPGFTVLWGLSTTPACDDEDGHACRRPLALGVVRHSREPAGAKARLGKEALWPVRFRWPPAATYLGLTTTSDHLRRRAPGRPASGVHDGWTAGAAWATVMWWLSVAPARTFSGDATRGMGRSGPSVNVLPPRKGGFAHASQIPRVRLAWRGACHPARRCSRRSLHAGVSGAGASVAWPALRAGWVTLSGRCLGVIRQFVVALCVGCSWCIIGVTPDEFLW